MLRFTTREREPRDPAVQRHARVPARRVHSSFEHSGEVVGEMHVGAQKNANSLGCPRFVFSTSLELFVIRLLELCS